MPCAGRGDDEATGGVDEVTEKLERHGVADGNEYDDDFEESLSEMDEGSQRAVADVGGEHSRSMDLNDLAGESNSPTRLQKSMNGTGRRPTRHEYRKHGLCFHSGYRSASSIGFGTARRECAEKSTSSTKARNSKGQGSKVRRHESSVSRVSSAGSNTGSSVKRAALSQAARARRTEVDDSYSPAETMWGRTAHGYDKRSTFAGKTTFGTASLPYQRPPPANQGQGPSRPLPGRILHGGRFSRTRTETALEQLCREKAQLPGPGQYDTTVSARQPGGKFNSANPPTVWDSIQRLARTLPAPGAHQRIRPWSFTGESRTPGGHIMPKGGRVMYPNATKGRRDRATGKVITVATAMRNLEPAPGHYHVDF